VTKPKSPDKRNPVWDMIGSLGGRWPKGFPRTVDDYIDFVSGGSYDNRNHPLKRKPGPPK